MLEGKSVSATMRRVVVGRRRRRGERRWGRVLAANVTSPPCVHVRCAVSSRPQAHKVTSRVGGAMAAVEAVPLHEVYVNEIKLENNPEDGISSVVFSPFSNNHLIASSWDCTLRLYDVSNNKQECKFELGAPLLDCCCVSQSTYCCGSLDQSVSLCHLKDNYVSRIGHHDNAVRSVLFCSELNTIVTGSWDFTVRGWDVRDHHSNSFTLPQENKVYSMSSVDTTLVVGTSNRKILIWDLRSARTPVSKRDSSLKYQTRKVECFSTKDGFVVSSIEGRVAVEFFDLEDQHKKYAFKCHRTTTQEGIELIYPINAISFHPQHGTFATGGSDGLVSIWDPFNKKRICQLHRFPTSISSLSFSSDGSMLAIASSYQFEEQEKESAPDTIFVRHVTDTETKQRPN